MKWREIYSFISSPFGSATDAGLSSPYKPAIHLRTLTRLRGRLLPNESQSRPVARERRVQMALSVPHPSREMHRVLGNAFTWRATGCQQRNVPLRAFKS